MNQAIDDCIKIARLALKEYLTTGKTISLPNECPKELKEKRAGVFVSLHKGPELRGCIGTITPAKTNLAQELIANAIAACHDPRFSPVSKDELNQLSIKIDILSPLEKTTRNKLDAKKYGVYIKTEDGRSGLLLPDLEGVNSVNQQLAVVRQKAGIGHFENVQIYRFTVERHK